MITIGNQTSCWARTPTEPFEYAVANGFDAFEWFPDKKPGLGWDESDLDEPLRHSIRETAVARGLRLSVHARWQANPLQPESGPLLLEDLDLARAVGAALLNIHLYHESGLDAYARAITPLVQRVTEAGLQLSVENTPQHSPEDFNELFARLRSLGLLPAHHIGMCLDLGHANLSTSTHNNYLGFLDRLDPQVPIIHLHLHENWGDADTHLPLFTGPAGRNDAGIRGLVERLQRRQFSGSIILEQWPNPPTLLNQARDRLRQMLEMESFTAQPATPQLGTPTPSQPAGEGVGAPSASPTCAHPPGPGPSPNEEDFLQALVAADRGSRSWREKLAAVQNLLAADHPSSPPASSDSASRPKREPSAAAASLTTEQLVDVAIYLRFLGTGEIPCVEDGRHFRPAHHARLAQQIEQRLTHLATPDNAYVLRKIYPWLPSAAQTFQRPEPLTRIRDIAHRNDIPPDLKHEIKHSLQNKLHRCAGPEDLVTSTAMLARITVPGANYSATFVEQFRIFHEELKEFFNARSLDERLAALLASVDTRQADLIRAFLKAKEQIEPENPQPGPNADTPPRARQQAAAAPALLARKSQPTFPKQLAALEALTALRQSLLDTTAKDGGNEHQDLLLADVGLEDFAFVLLSQLNNAFEPVTPDSASSWEPLLTALRLTITNLALSGVAPEECRALTAELRGWQDSHEPEGRDRFLRLKASADRARRLAEDYSDHIMALFPQRVQKLGRALGVAEPSLRVFCEADIRGHIIFQCSKLVSCLQQRLRTQLALPDWDVVVSGQAVGRVRTARSLDELSQSASEPLVVRLEAAEGDEEIPSGVAAVLLAHEIPHLSHLGVRARQAGVVFVTTDAPASFDSLKAVEGQVITLVATPEQVVWSTDLKSAATAPSRHLPSAICHLPSVPPSAIRHLPSDLSAGTCISLDNATAERAGGKADGARRLSELAGRTGAGFKTPPALVVPFGVMESTCHATPELEAEYRQLVRQADGLKPEALATVAERLRVLVHRLVVPESIVKETTTKFGRATRLMVRSSANCEDLEQFAGAGLYESVPDVASADVAAAVRTVWASLWTRRAALSRQQSGLPHQQAQMAVLIQQMLTPDLSFVLHTVNPINQNPREVYAEIAVGLGEILASAATRGSPYRLVCAKDSAAVTTLAFASFSHALRPGSATGLTRQTVDYSRLDLTRDASARTRLGSRLAAVARVVETAFHGPQDIEGVVVNDEIYLVQSRPQQGLGASPHSTELTLPT